ncbi:phytanoyl-CoA dioxygenase family protein [Chitinophaga ginsengisoli]|uniref:Phytanoyl-CoA dioxygenase PhyH n=1 Tax=Chitinophaga ginsengisoli TaxID=363837 RepID=A0A2P8GN38_9BACT|nr:phytanoyl-CoA dioxygenase family protein [Chitinophaga ginsengisoli]PSL35369.1 phytanoyl-CoA dioxygenase PhyH [Chitinophaga ginsengisoli]
MSGSMYQQEIAANGFTVIENVFTDREVDSLIALIQQADSSKATFRKTKDLFAIRQFLRELPDAVPAIITPTLMAKLNELFGEGYQVVKSIYFDKPGDSNWFVSYHQDLTISVKDKADVPGFGPWTVKQQQYAVQPPLRILENNFTVRIHLDDTDEHNGALRVIPGSHRKGIYRPETIDWSKETEVSCNVSKGGIMIMRPLLLHASSRTTNNHKRRVIHIEFSNQELPASLQWSELLHN